MLKQNLAICRMNLLGIVRRPWSSLSLVVTIALVVVVLLGFLAMNSGFNRTLSSGGSEKVLIALRTGSQGEVTSALDREQTQLLSDSLAQVETDFAPRISPEVYVIVTARKKSSGSTVSLPFRGLKTTGIDLRQNVALIEGRLFAPGSNEIVVGRGVIAEYSGFILGDEIRFGTSRWVVVGVFADNGSVTESEIWGDLRVVQNAFGRDTAVQSVRLATAGHADSLAIKRAISKQPRLALSVLSEADYLSNQAAGTTSFVRYLGWPLSIIMAFGAFAGGLNAIFASVDARRIEIATLRAIGFQPTAVFVGVLVEAVTLALIGALLGFVITYLVFDGLTTSLSGSSFTQVVFQFRLTRDDVINGLVLALIIGILGGVFPAIQTIRRTIVAGLRP